MAKDFLKLMENWKGYKSARGARFSEAQITGALNLISNKDRMPAYEHEYRLKEAITTSDFPNLFGFVIDREVMARYMASVADWKSYFRMKTVQNFNTVERHKVIGADERLPLVSEKGEYLVSPMSEGSYDYKVYKRGQQFDISWESIVNDVLGAFADIPERYANAAIRTEAWQATTTYAGAAAPAATLFGAPIVDAADGANVTNLGALALTVPNLETTLGLMLAQVDANGEPISPRGVHLVVPPQLEITARAIISSGLLLSTAAAPIPATNIIPQMGLKLHVDNYLPVRDTGNGDTTWYLFAEPSAGAAMEYAYLRGHETPEICMKNSNKVSVAGAPLSAMSGDFATDNIFYRVRVVCGSGAMDPRFAYAQVG